MTTAVFGALVYGEKNLAHTLRGVRYRAAALSINQAPVALSCDRQTTTQTAEDPGSRKTDRRYCKHDGEGNTDGRKNSRMGSADRGQDAKNFIKPAAALTSSKAARGICRTEQRPRPRRQKEKPAKG